MLPPILDATCASRMIWFDKDNGMALFVDRREVEDEAIWKSGTGMSKRFLSIHPDVIADFTELPFPNETFWHVVFDPPHLIHSGDQAWMTKKYGRLDAAWQETLRIGFNECMRVLKPYGTLIFKWSEVEISVNDVIKAIGQEPLYGCRCGKRRGTHWMAFVKLVSGRDKKSGCWEEIPK